VNVVIINDNAHVNGGAAKVAIQEAVGLADRGYKIYFVCAVEPIARELIHPNISVCCSQQDDLLGNPNPAAAFVQGWWNTRAAQLTSRIVTRLKGSETIVHLHTWSRALSASTIRAAIDSDISVVCTLHDFMLACPSGTFFNHAQQQVCRLRPLSAACLLTNCDTRSYTQKLYRVGRQVIQGQMGKAPAGISHFIVHSKLACEVMTPYLPRDCTFHSLPIYVEGSQHPPAQPETNHNLVYLGRLVREKGVLLAAKAAAAEGVPLTFVGAGPLAEQIHAACPQAIITGWVDHATSVQYLRQARALVFPSLWYETLGLVVLEAAAHGIPSLVPDTSAAREIVLDGVTGLHFKSGDDLDLRAKMKQLQNADLVRGLGREAYERFWSSDYCSLNAHLSSLGVIYQKIVRAQMIADKFPVLPVEVQRVG
jgi:glycosyltransferase involved in cell wall biosynthesis